MAASVLLGVAETGVDVVSAIEVGVTAAGVAGWLKLKPVDDPLEELEDLAKLDPFEGALPLVLLDEGVLAAPARVEDKSNFGRSAALVFNASS